jgi:hypothetical protein
MRRALGERKVSGGSHSSARLRFPKTITSRLNGRTEEQTIQGDAKH